MLHPCLDKLGGSLFATIVAILKDQFMFYFMN